MEWTCLGVTDRPALQTAPRIFLIIMNLMGACVNRSRFLLAVSKGGGKTAPKKRGANLNVREADKSWTYQLKPPKGLDVENPHRFDMQTDICTNCGAMAAEVEDSIVIYECSNARSARTPTSA